MSRSSSTTLAKIDQAVAIATKNGRRADTDGVVLLRKLRGLIERRRPLAMMVDDRLVPISIDDITVRRTVLEVDLVKHDLGTASFTPGEVRAEYDYRDDVPKLLGYGVPANDDRDVIVDFDVAV